MTTTYMISAPSREALFIALYRSVFPGVASFIRKRGGSLEEAKDVFQDALLIYYEKTRNPEFVAEKGDEAYLAGICKHLWYKTHERKPPLVALDSPEDLSEAATTPAVSKRLLLLIERSGKKCLDLLKAFYYDQLSMKELSDSFGYAGERSATVQKHKCLEKVRDEIKARTLNPDDFYE